MLVTFQADDPGLAHGIGVGDLIPWATGEAPCQVTTAGSNLAAAIIDCGLRAVVWRLDGGGLLHRVIFAQRVTQLAMQAIQEEGCTCASLWAVGADGTVFHQELRLDCAHLELAHALPLRQVQHIACGAAHVLALADERIFSWSGTAPIVPTAVEMPEPWQKGWHVVAVAAGGATSACVLAQLQQPRRGRYLETAVLSWGRGPQLGRLLDDGGGERGGEAAAAQQPAEVAALRGMQVVRLSVGPEHAVASTLGGIAMSWGEGDQVSTSALCLSACVLSAAAPLPLFHTRVAGSARRARRAVWRGAGRRETPPARRRAHERAECTRSQLRRGADSRDDRTQGARPARRW